MVRAFGWIAALLLAGLASAAPASPIEECRELARIVAEAERLDQVAVSGLLGAERCAMLHPEQDSAEVRCLWARASAAEAKLHRVRIRERIRACFPGAAASETSKDLTRIWPSPNAEAEVGLAADERAVTLELRPVPRPSALGRWIYLGLFLLPLLWLAAERLPGRWRDVGPGAVFAALVAIYGLRYRVGSDWDNYVSFLLSARTVDFPLGLAAADPAYLLLNLLAAQAGAGIWLVDLACAALLAAGVVRFCAIQARPPIALVAAVPVLLGITAISLTRQAAAIGLVLLALAAWQTGARRRGALLLILAPLFHWSAAILLPLVVLCRVRTSIPLRHFVLGGLAAGVAAGGTYLLVTASDPAAAGSGIPKGAPFRLAPTLGALLVYAALARRIAPETDRDRTIGFLAAIACFVAVLTFAVPLAGDRLGMYAVPLQMAVFPLAVGWLQGWRLKRMAEAVLFAGYAVFFALWLATTRYGPCLLPYDSYLAQPERFAAAPEAALRRSGLCQAIQDQEGELLPDGRLPP